MTVADHDGHTINVGVPDRIGPPTIDTDAFRKRHHPVNPVRYDGDADGLVTDGPAVCPRCATQGWPCDASRLADEVDRLRAELAEARNAANEALGCRFIHDQCDCGDTAACGVCHMIERLRLLRDGAAKVQEAET